MIALYKEERRQSIVPGTFLAMTIVEPGKKIENCKILVMLISFFPSSV
ncbi:CamS family sex pheromone protein [Anaerobacillus sp. HL2]|nr:CamS family sex pheromone protein [Anaerobacillus sp. HL2]